MQRREIRKQLLVMSNLHYNLTIELSIRINNYQFMVHLNNQKEIVVLLIMASAD
jgi:hypothetical protein